MFGRITKIRQDSGLPEQTRNGKNRLSARGWKFSAGCRIWLAGLFSMGLFAQPASEELWSRIRSSVAEVRIQKQLGNPRGPEAIRQILLNGALVDARMVPTIIKSFQGQAIGNPAAGYAVTYVGLHWNWLSQDPKDRQVQVELVGPNQQIFPATLIGVDQRSGVAVLKLPQTGILSVTGAGKDLPQKATVECYPIEMEGRTPVGEKILLERSPDGPGMEYSTPFQSRFRQGQPLFTADGAFWGFFTGNMQSSGKENRILAVPSSQFSSNIQSIISTGNDVTAGWIGIFMEERKGPNDKDQVVVTQVAPDSPAFIAGLRRGDRLLEIDGHSLKGMQDLSSRIRWTVPGNRSRIRLEREGKSMVLPLTVSQRKTAFDFAVDPPQYYLQVSPTDARSGLANVQLAEVWPPVPPPPDQMTLSSLLNRKPVLGIVGDDLTPQLGEYFGVKDGRGVLINSVKKGSLAEKNGMKAGDVILSLNDMEIANQMEFAVVLDSLESATQWIFRLMRERKPLEIRIVREAPPKE